MAGIGGMAGTSGFYTDLNEAQWAIIAPVLPAAFAWLGCRRRMSKDCESASAGLLAAWLAPFACLFTRPTWGRVPALVEGALLTLHRRTVSAALRAAGRDIAPGFARYHRVLAETRSVCGWEPGALIGAGGRACCSGCWWVPSRRAVRW